MVTCRTSHSSFSSCLNSSDSWWHYPSFQGGRQLFQPIGFLWLCEQDTKAILITMSTSPFWCWDSNDCATVLDIACRFFPVGFQRWKSISEVRIFERAWWGRRLRWRSKIFFSLNDDNAYIWSYRGYCYGWMFLGLDIFFSETIFCWGCSFAWLESLAIIQLS